VDQTFYSEPHPYWVSLFDIRVIMAIMHVHVVKLLCHTVMRLILLLECLLSGMSGHLWLCLVCSCIALNALATQGRQLLGHMTDTSNPRRGY
jgi:hypothetical protein